MDDDRPTDYSSLHNVVNFLRSKMVRLDGRIWDYIVNNTRKSAIADKPREAFVQMQWRS